MANLFTLSGLAPVVILKRTWVKIRVDDVFGHAAQLAYYFFLALFPFLICIIATLSVFGSADRGRALLFSFVARIMPASAFELITATFDEIIQSSGPLKMGLGILATLVSASLGMSAIMDTLNATYRVPETRSILKQYAIAIALTLAMGLFIVISTLIVVMGDHIAATLPLPPAAFIVWKIAKWPVAVALLLSGFAVTYYFAPDLKHPEWHWISPGAVAGVALFILVSIGLRIYLHFYGSYTATYGSLGGVIVLLLHFYLGGVAVLSGGALNAVMEELASRRRSDSERARKNQSQ